MDTTLKKISAKPPSIVAARRQTAAFPNEIKDAALCRGAATPVLQRFPLGLEMILNASPKVTAAHHPWAE
jgi:hypothetical protein